MERIATVNEFLVANKLHASCVSLVERGSVSTFDLQIQNDFRINKFASLLKELMLVLKSTSIPSIILDSNSGFLQFETISNQTIKPELFNIVSDIRTGFNPILNLGLNFKGEVVSVDITQNPHMLVGGATGSGKSGLMHTIVTNLLVASQAELHIVDTKGIEFLHYEKFSHRVKTYDSFDNFAKLLRFLISTMEYRYMTMRFAKTTHISDIGYIKPIVVMIDEFADLIMQDRDNECHSMLCRLAQKCRAAGIYIILATQRPSADIITGVIKANFPARLACKVVSKIDSRIILDQNGAEQINQVGGAMLKNYKYECERLQIAYASIDEIDKFLTSRKIQ